MSKLFVCIGKKAVIPYSIPAEHLRVSSVEELCYYICDRAKVLDAGFMREPLAEFVREQLSLPELADELTEMLQEKRSLHEFCAAILDYAGYPDSETRTRIVQSIEENETLPVVRRLQKQGDSYAQQKQYYLAQKSYRHMLLRDDVQADSVLLAEIYERLGNVSAQMFQYETAAYCFEKSCRFEERRRVRKKYLLCQRLLMPKARYLEWLATKEEYYELSVDVERDYELAQSRASMQMQEKETETQMQELKEAFRRMVLE